MEDIISLLRSQPSFVHMVPASESSITYAESSLNVQFASEYREYVSTFGAVAIKGHEFTGVCNSARLNVVNVTLDERQQNNNIPFDWYVLEQTGIDGIVIWQDRMGQVFQSNSAQQITKVAHSLAEYIRG